MTSSIELFPAQQEFAVAGEAFVREQIHVSVVSQVVAQSKLNVLENPTEETVAPKLKGKSLPSTTFTSPRESSKDFPCLCQVVTIRIEERFVLKVKLVELLSDLLLLVGVEVVVVECYRKLLIPVFHQVIH